MRRALWWARRLGPHLLVSAVVFALAGQGLDYRALWQDEVETAERARTILESGVPRVIDRSGELSVNWGGHELDEDSVHRYNTWGQFYVAALGLAFGRAVGMDPDASVRLPFVAAHAATAGLVSMGLSALAGVPLPVSLAAGAIVSIQTPRLVHNRTARYHGLLDVLTVLGLVAVGAWRNDQRWARWLFGAILFCLPHVHVFGGSVLGLGLSVLALYVACERQDVTPHARRRDIALYVLVPGVLSLTVLLWLVRPWAYTAMGAGLAFDLSQLLHFKTVGNVRHLGYAGIAIAIGLAILIYHNRWRPALALGSATMAMVVAIRILDFNVLTQPWAMRYYLAAPLLGLFWAIALGLDGLSKFVRGVLVVAIAAVALSPEVMPSAPGQPGFAPLWGIQLALSDARHSVAGDKQPLHRAIEMIHARAQPNDPVAIDYVPQFVPWYLSGHPTALVPDTIGRHTANWNNPVWARPVQFPRWHLRYTHWPNGTWPCSPNCDYHWSGDLRQGRYDLTSKKLARQETFCIHGVWPTNPWNNSPPLNYQSAASTPEGIVEGALVLGGPCQPQRAVSERQAAVRAETP